MVRRLAPVAFLALVCVLSFLAGGRTLGAGDSGPVFEVAATYVVGEGSLEQIYAVNVEVRRDQVRSINYRGSPVRLTGVAGGALSLDEVVFWADGAPVVIAGGGLPAYRDLAYGARGDDVEQLQRLLARLGHFDGEIDGRFGRSTETSVKAWQKDLGVRSPSGQVREHDVLWVWEEDVLLALADGLVKGSDLVDGDPLIELLAAEPHAVVTVTSTVEAHLLAADREAIIVDLGRNGAGVLGSRLPDDEEGSIVYEVLELPTDAVSGNWRIQRFAGRLVVVPPVAGIVVPLAAVGAGPEGPRVQRPDGSYVGVTLVAVVGGEAVVRGLASGDEVVLPFGRALPPGGMAEP